MIEPVTPASEVPDGYVDIQFVVEPNYAGWRLDRYLCEKIRRLSRDARAADHRARLICDATLKPSTPGARRG